MSAQLGAGALCQSCSMPLAKDRNGGGTESDGSRSLKYCSFCYAEGAFKRPQMTSGEMQTQLMGVLARQGVGRVKAWLITRRVPFLQRWRRAF